MTDMGATERLLQVIEEIAEQQIRDQAGHDLPHYLPDPRSRARAPAVVATRSCGETTWPSRLTR
jgi:hypothetical protein